MTQETLIHHRLATLPPKVAVPFRHLLAAGQLTEDVLAVVLDAGDLANDPSRLVGFAVGYLHLRSQGVPVHDVVRMAKSQQRRINHDPDVENPCSCDDALRIVVLHRRYIDPSNGACGDNPDEIAAWERENAAEWFSIPLFLYDHSGTVYRVAHSNPFHCPWDSRRVGILALKRAEWGNGAESDDKLTEYAAAIAAEYSNWANGECYGYVLCDAAGHEIESRWGFIGIDAARKEAAAAAEAH